MMYINTLSEPQPDSSSYPILPKITLIFTHRTILIPIKSNFTHKIALKEVQNATRADLREKKQTKWGLFIPAPYTGGIQ